MSKYTSDSCRYFRGGLRAMTLGLPLLVITPFLETIRA